MEKKFLIIQLMEEFWEIAILDTETVLRYAYTGTVRIRMIFAYDPVHYINPESQQ